MFRSALVSLSRRVTALPRIAVPQQASYHQRVIDHYENPRNVGSKNRADPNVGTAVVGAPACGDVMKLQIETSMGSSITVGRRGGPLQ